MRFYAAFGLVALVLWGALAYALHSAQREVMDRAHYEGRDLARLLAVHVASSMRAIDLTLESLRDEWLRDPSAFDSAVARHSKHLNDELAIQVGVIGANGKLVYSSTPGWQRVDLSDREYFQELRKATRDELNISRPVLGRVSGIWTIQLSRAIHNRHGHFAGVILVSLPPPALEKIYNDISRNDQRISLNRLDGYFIARSRNLADIVNKQLTPASAHWMKPGSPPSGEELGVSAIEGFDGMIAYRKVAGYPLVVTVLRPADSLLASYRALRNDYLVAGAIATALLLALALTLRARERQTRTAQLDRARLAAIVQDSSDAITSIDSHGLVESWNGGAERLFGYTPAEMIGRDVTAVTVPPDRVEEIRKVRVRVGRGEPVAPFDTVRIAKDGRRIDVSISVSPIRDSSGNVCACSETLRDVTEQKRAELAQATLAAIVENTNEAIIGRGLDGKVISWNAAAERLLGYTAAEAIGKEMGEIFPPGLTEVIAKNRAVVRAGGRIADRESVRLNKAGQLIDVMVSFSPIRDKNGVLIGTAGMLRDIRGRKRSEALREELLDRLALLGERLVTAQEAERRKIAYDLHEQLGQELTGLNFRLRALAVDPSGAAAESNLAAAIALADRVLGRVRRMSLHLAPPYLNDLGLSAAVEHHCLQQAAATGLTIHVDAPELKIRPAAALETACFRLLQESLTNVIRHARASEVWVKLYRSGDELGLSVRDNGTGFDIEALSSRSKRDSLGLFSMEQRASHVGGRLEIISSPGAGTEVRAIFRLDLGSVVAQEGAAA